MPDTPNLLKPGVNWSKDDWNLYCAAGTPKKCPNGQDISNLSHAVCAATAPFQWKCLGKVESFGRYANPIPPLF